MTLSDPTSALPSTPVGAGQLSVPVATPSLQDSPMLAAPTLNECRIVPDEDLQRAVATLSDEEDDRFFGLMGKGIGDDDDAE